MNDFSKKVIYQLYPKSFKDSNGDGFGDIRGVIEEIDYLAKLGADIVWMNPFYPSPQHDNGYDISDYKAIDPRFGTMEDFEELVKVAEEKGISIMLDMVFNHTSTEHEWFKKALAGDKKYQDYYIIRPAKEDGSVPTNWRSKFGGSAWEKFGNTNDYYLHLYERRQADLNWRNPEVRRELIDVVNFWLEKGVKGFRFDVLNVIGKDAVLVDSDGNESQEKLLYTDREIVHDYIRELNENSFGRYKDIVTVGEMSSTTIENGILYTNPNRHELSMIFSFHHLKVDYKDGEKWSKVPFDFIELKKIINEWQVAMSDGGGWNALFWNNHDQPRANSRFGDVDKYPYETTTMLATTIHMLRGTPYIYQGEEIGMTNPNFKDINDYDDVESKNAFDELIAKGIDEKTAMSYIMEKSRDNSRTPMQWDATANAGFTKGTPWLKVADNFREINVAKELKEGKIFNYYKKLIELRKKYEIISQGSYYAINLQHEEIFAYGRQLDGKKMIVLNNFYDKPSEISLDTEVDFAQGKILLSNYEDVKLSNKITLRPYESIVIYFE